MEPLLPPFQIVPSAPTLDFVDLGPDVVTEFLPVAPIAAVRTAFKLWTSYTDTLVFDFLDENNEPIKVPEAFGVYAVGTNIMIPILLQPVGPYGRHYMCDCGIKEVHIIDEATARMLGSAPLPSWSMASFFDLQTVFLARKQNSQESDYNRQLRVLELSRRRNGLLKTYEQREAFYRDIASKVSTPFDELMKR